jgi:glycerophosphoryl diester phosphodiesterase
VTAIFAHRGCTTAARENTLDAFRAARRAGADGVELDVRLTADGQLAVHHDRHVPHAPSITNVRASELPAYVPLLPEALGACEGMSVNVELKHDAGTDPERRVAAVAASTLAGRRSVIVSSFDPDALSVVRRLAPDVPCGLLVDWKIDPMAGLSLADSLGCASLHPFVTQVDATLVEAACCAGLGLHVWTVNADADLREMAALGVQAVITDRVAAAVALLRDGNRNGGAAGG